MSCHGPKTVREPGEGSVVMMSMALVEWIVLPVEAAGTVWRAERLGLIPCSAGFGADVFCCIPVSRGGCAEGPEAEARWMRIVAYVSAETGMSVEAWRRFAQGLVEAKGGVS